MSYNISTWKTKKLNDFRIPVAEIPMWSRQSEGFQRREGLDPQHNLSEGSTLFELGACYIFGTVIEGWLHVQKISLRDDFSGHVMFDMMIPLFAKTTGELTAVLIWESGDSSEVIKVVDGVYSSTDLEELVD